MLMKKSWNIFFIETINPKLKVAYKMNNNYRITQGKSHIVEIEKKFGK